MKRLTTAILILTLVLTAASGCTLGAKDRDGKLRVVCTVFPQYDWVRQILGDHADNVELTLLLNNRIDLHNYQPSVDDIVRISGCDLFIYVGGVSDTWADDVLRQAANKNMVVINLLETLGDSAKLEELVEGMEEEDHDDGDEEDDHHDDEDEYDEHVWLSLKNARLFCEAIAEALSSIDLENAGMYRENFAAYTGKLSALDAEYKAAVDAAPVKTLLFGDRFPFRYLADDYGLTYYAAFAGCSAETEASFNTVIFLAGKMDELNLKNVMVTESSDKKLAETIIRQSKGSGQRILALDAMQSVARGDVADGVTYISIMESNLKVLKEALS